jgi:hypothetical protein
MNQPGEGPFADSRRFLGRMTVTMECLPFAAFVVMGLPVTRTLRKSKRRYSQSASAIMQRFGSNDEEKNAGFHACG